MCQPVTGPDHQSERVQLAGEIAWIDSAAHSRFLVVQTPPLQPVTHGKFAALAAHQERPRRVEAFSVTSKPGSFGPWPGRETEGPTPQIKIGTRR
jgi:hypothetical protein